MEEIMNNLKTIRNNILLDLFNNDETCVNNFINNNQVKLNNSFEFMLEYPNCLYKFLVKETNIIELSDEIKKIIVKNEDRCIHPALIIICYDKLEGYIRFTNVYDEYGNGYFLSIRSIHKIRQQTINIFEIYYKLLTEQKLNYFFKTYETNILISEIKKSLYYKLTVEKIVRTFLNLFDAKNYRFSDLTINLNVSKEIYEQHVSEKMKQKNLELISKKNLNDIQKDYLKQLIVEINEGHHIPLIDNIRKLSIYTTTGKLSIDYSITNMNFMDIFKNILKEISKVIYKYYDETIGVIFYCSVVSNLDVDYAPFFWSLHQNTKITNKGVQINEVVNFLKIFGLSKPKKLLEIILNELEDDEEYFHELNYDNYNSSFLNSLGVDRVLLLPRKNDFPKIKSVIKIYNEFKTEFFNSMINFFNDDDECSYSLTLSNQLLQTQTVNNMLQI